MKRKFVASVENLMSKNFQDQSDFSQSLKSVVNLIYNVRNNIFHGNKGRFELENRGQQIRLRIYALILQSVCQLAIEAIAKRSNNPQILKSYFEPIRPRRNRAYAEEVSFDSKEDLCSAPLGNLFYPCSGVDTYTPLKYFLHSRIQTFYFADISYENDWRRLPFEAKIMGLNPTNTHDASRIMQRQDFRRDGPLIGKEHVTEIEKKQSRPMRNSYFSLQTDFGEVKILHPPHNEYELTIVTGEKKGIHIYSSDAFSAFQTIDNISVFFFRLDGVGEGGSNQLWLSPSLFPHVMEKLNDGGLIITDGANGHMAPDLQLKSDVSTFEYNGATFALCGKFDKDTRVWRIQKRVPITGSTSSLPSISLS